MGTDIHMRVQVEKLYEGKPYWSTIDPPAWWPRDEWDAKQIAKLTAEYAQTREVSTLKSLLWYTRQWYSGRSYNLFAILADVRNGSGFAGVLTGDGWPSIAPRRGLPDGVDIDGSDDDVWLGDHSHTWMTLAELLAFNWHGTRTRLCGVVDLDKYTPGVKPTQWCGDVWGQNHVTVEEPQVDGLVVPAGTQVHVRQWWEQSAAEAEPFFHSEIIPALVRLASEQGVTHDQVRLVMGFDS